MYAAYFCVLMNPVLSQGCRSHCNRTAVWLLVGAQIFLHKALSHSGSSPGETTRPGTWGTFCGTSQLQREANYFPPFSTGVKNASSYVSAFRDNFRIRQIWDFKLFKAKKAPYRRREIVSCSPVEPVLGFVTCSFAAFQHPPNKERSLTPPTRFVVTSERFTRSQIAALFFCVHISSYIVSLYYSESLSYSYRRSTATKTSKFLKTYFIYRVFRLTH